MIQTYLLCESDEPSVRQLVIRAFHLHEATLGMVLWIKWLRFCRAREQVPTALWPSYLKPLILGWFGDSEVSGMISLIHLGALKLCQLQMMAFLVIKTDRELQWWSANGLCYGPWININYEGSLVGLVVKKDKIPKNHCKRGSLNARLFGSGRQLI